MAVITCTVDKATTSLAEISNSGSCRIYVNIGTITYNTDTKKLNFTFDYRKDGNNWQNWGRYGCISKNGYTYIGNYPSSSNENICIMSKDNASNQNYGANGWSHAGTSNTITAEITDFPLTLYICQKASMGAAQGNISARNWNYEDTYFGSYGGAMISTGKATIVVSLPAGLITYYKNDGTTDNTTQTIIYGEQTTIYPSSTFSRDGYSFSRWNTAASGGGTNYYAGASITPTSSMDLWAIWAPLTYTITYDYNDSTRDPFSVQGPYDSTITLPSAPTRTGYTFVEWNTASDGSGTGYAAGVSYTIHGNETLYAIWNINSYTITYNIDGTEDSYTVHYGTVMTLPIPTKPHHRIDGWNTKADGSGIMYEAGSDFTVVEDITLYAIWIFYDYLITFYHNDGTGRSSEEIVISGNTIKILNVEDLKQQGYTRYGYQLLYWTTNVDGTGTKYMADAVITPTASMDLYAQWTEKPHGIVKLKQSSASEWEDGYYRYKNGNSWIVPRKIYVKIDGVWRQIIQRPDNGETISVVGEED